MANIQVRVKNATKAPADMAPYPLNLQSRYSYGTFQEVNRAEFAIIGQNLSVSSFHQMRETGVLKQGQL